ncbi:protein-methionine-sulfoxide reductase catalytic subunit MsrP [Glaciecola sp. 1036]|uniref:protein-methionine-sulfoxide reductase catalytic subunit MsrP n=1 Tax=Alteromonadaceae TaxID=72275 RepID=UPI003CFF480F
MLIKTKKPHEISEHYVTDESLVTQENVWQERRSLLKKLGYMGAMTALATSAHAGPFDWFKKEAKEVFKRRPLASKNTLTSKDKLTEELVATAYNNFYEFGTDKSDPVTHSQSFQVDPWQIKIDGLVEKPITLNYEDIFNLFPLEERIYRLRCVETWSMVIPWIGFPLAALLKKVKPLSSAKYVAFETLHSPSQMRGQRNRFLGGGIDYPYVEGLRIDEAMHDLTLLSVGLYGQTLPPQNGAPIRLVVPWKYGFKSIKSIVKIKLTDKQPPTTWNILASNEYGFYANVNPNVAHPRWSQARERRILGTGLNDQKRIDTQLFNGYTEVAELYKDMDLRKYY